MRAGASICSECGAVIPKQALEGLCPRCIAAAMRMGLNSAASARGSGSPLDEDSLTPEPTDASPASEFLLLRKLAQGGMGMVFEAHDPKLERKVVIKLLRPDRETQASSVDRFMSEARITGQLEHPAIVPVYKLGTLEDGRPFYAMRHIEGDTLAAVLVRLKQQDAETAAQYSLSTLLNVFQKVCDAVAYAHSHRIMHRDLKPDNIMIGRFGEVVVMDWGLAKRCSSPQEPVGHAQAKHGDVVEVIEPVEHGDSPGGHDEEAQFRFATPAGHKLSESTHTLDNTIMGTPGYMAPEQAAGSSNRADERSDIYSLGAILYSILTLEIPGSGSGATSILERTRSGNIPSPADYAEALAKAAGPHSLPHCPNHRVPPALSAVAMKAISLKPETRYQTVLDLQKDVAAYQSGLVTTAEEAGWRTRAWYWTKRNRTAAAVAALILVLVAAFSWRNWQTLTELRGTAPALIALAESLISNGRFSEALERLDVAARLQPNRSDVWILRGQSLLPLLRIDEARENYTRALKIDSNHSTARQGLEFCEELLVTGAGQSVWTKERLIGLYRGFVQRGLSSQAYEIYRRLEAADEDLMEFWNARLAAAGLTNRLEWIYHRPSGLRFLQTGLTNQFILDARKYLALNLQGSEIADLSPLEGLPLRELNLSDCRNISDLAPLRGMPLVGLIFSMGSVSDLSPLSGMPLEVLNFSFNRVQDLGPLRSIRTLRQLGMNNVDVLDLAPLAQLPLESLTFSSTLVTSLEPLRGMPLVELSFAYVNVADLKPVSDLLLQYFVVNNVDLTSIESLRGQPLRILHLQNCRFVTDLSPLENCRTLEELILPPNATGIEFLRDFPRIREIGYRWPGTSPEDFWRAHDDRKLSLK